MRFHAKELEIPGLVEIEHERAQDERGFFAEVFRAAELEKSGIPGPFVQENQSRSRKGVLRGLHYQVPPRSQGKLVRCLRGAIFDVAVDLRRGSPSYGRWVGRELGEDSRRVLYVPPGCAHGFYALSETADVVYSLTDYYSPAHERGVRWDDPDLGIAWPGRSPVLSAKDAAYPFLGEAEHPFRF